MVVECRFGPGSNPFPPKTYLVFFFFYLINVKRFRINSAGLIKYSDMDLALILTTLLSKSQRCRLLGGTGYVPLPKSPFRGF